MTAAITACRTGVSVLLLLGEPIGRRAHRPSVETVGYQGQAALQRLGLFKLLLAHSPSVTGRMSTSDGRGTVDRPSLLNPFAAPRIIEKNEFNSSFLACVISEGVSTTQLKLTNARRTNSGLAIVLSDGTSVFARSVVDASGAVAKVGRLLGARRQTLDHLTCSWIETTRNAQDRDLRICIDAQSEGWLFSLLSPTGRRTFCAFSEHRANRAGRRQASYYVLECVRNSRLMGRLKLDLPVVSAGVTTAASSLLVPAAGNGWIACGDAAITRDPLSASGTSWAIDNASEAALLAVSGLDESVADKYSRSVARAFSNYQGERGQVYGAISPSDPGDFYSSRAKVG